MLTLAEALQGFGPYLQGLRLNPEHSQRYTTFVQRYIPVAVFRRLPCSRYRPVPPDAVVAGLGAQAAAYHRWHWEQFHHLPERAGGVAFLTMGDWVDAYEQFVAAEQKRKAPCVHAATFVQRLAETSTASLPLAILDRRLCREIVTAFPGLSRKARFALRHFFRYLQEQGWVSFPVLEPAPPRWRREVEALLTSIPACLSPATPLQTALGAYYHFCLNACNVAESGLKLLYRNLQAFVNWLGANGLELAAGEVSRPLIDAFLAYRETQRGNSAVTIRHAARALKAFCAFLVAEGALAQNPLDGLVLKLPPPARPAGVLGVEEMERLVSVPRLEREALLARAPLRRNEQCRLFTVTRDWAILELLCYTGLRSVELRTARLQDLHPHGYLLVRGKGSRRHPHQERRVYFESPGTVAALEAYLELRPAGHGDILFLSAKGGLPLRAADLGRIVTTYARAAGIDRPLSPHRLRASFATALVAEGVDPLTLQALMGHERLATTLKSYTALDEAQLREVWKRTNPLSQLLPLHRQEGERDV